MHFIKKASNGYLWNQLLKFFEFALIFIFSVILARGLGETQYGLYSTLMSICAVVILFISTGMEEAIISFLPKYSEAIEKQNIVTLFLQLRIGIFILVATLLYFFAPIISTILNNNELSNLIRYSVLYIIFSSLANLVIHIYIAGLDLKTVFIVKTISLIFNATCSYFLLIRGQGIKSILAILTISSAFIVIVLAYRARHQPGFRPRRIEKNIMKFCCNIWLINIINFILGKQSDILMLSSLLGNQAYIGYYNVAFSLKSNISLLFISGLGGVGLTTVSRIIQSKDEKKIHKTIDVLIKMAVFLSIPLTIFSMINAQHIIMYIFSDQYAPSIQLLQIFIGFDIICRLMGGGIYVTLFYAIEKSNIVLVLRLISGIVNVILNLILIPEIGVCGAVIATGFSGLMLISSEMIWMRKYIKIKYPVQFIFKIVFSSLAAAAIVSIFPIYDLVGLIGRAAGYGLTLVIILYLLSPLTDEDKQIIANANQVIYKIIKYF